MPSPSERDLIGVWKSRDRRENRHVYVTRADGRYAYGFHCDARGMRLPGGRQTRVLLNAYGTALRNYYRPEPIR